MSTRLSDSRIDHNGEPVERQRSKSFSPRKFRSLDKARAAAVNHREEAREIVKAGNAVLRAERAASLTVGEL